MTRAQWFTAGSWLLLFWLLAGIWWAPGLERRLAQAAAERLSQVETGYEAVSVKFKGQHAVLTGRVRHEEMRQQILQQIAEQLRVPGLLNLELNPVASVSDALEVAPYPSGWLLLAVTGRRAGLSGRAATEAEARDVARLLEERWLAAGGRISAGLEADPARFDEAATLDATLTHLPAPPPAEGPDGAQLHLARLGGSWQRIQPDTEAEMLRTLALQQGLSESDWESVQETLQQTRRYQDRERARLAEAERQARLPPPHVLLAAREGRLLVRGEVAVMAQKRMLLNLLIEAFPDWRVLDDLRVHPARRAVAEFGPITTALLPSTDVESEHESKSLALGLSGEAWKFISWKEAAQSLTEDWRELLPKDLPAALLEADLRMVAEWLDSEARGIPALPVPAQPSFLTLTLLPGKAILSGQLAEEPMRMRLVQAARLVYGAKAVLLADGLLSRGTCQPTLDIEQTVRSLPPLPRAGEPPVLAFARPGQVWTSHAASKGLLEAGALAQTPLLPEGFPAAMAEHAFTEGFDHLRHHWRSNPKPETPEARP